MTLFLTLYVSWQPTPQYGHTESTCVSGTMVPASRAGISAPVGHACTHSPQATHVESPIGSSKSNTILEAWLRYAMPITSLTCTSRQARTHNPHWMQASRLTLMAGWLLSPGQRSAAGKRLVVTSILSAQFQNFESGSCEVSRAG